MKDSTKAIAQTLFPEDEKLDPRLAGLLVKANKINDAAAAFIQAAAKAMTDDKNPIYGDNETAVNRAVERAQNALREGGYAVKHLRSPKGDDFWDHTTITASTRDGEESATL